MLLSYLLFKSFTVIFFTFPPNKAGFLIPILTKLFNKYLVTTSAVSIDITIPIPKVCANPFIGPVPFQNNINAIIPEGETEETTTHDTLGANRISFEKVLDKSIELLN